MNIRDVQLKIAKFAQDRDWDQFHSPKNLCMAISAEVGELSELFQWLTEEQSKNLPSDPKKHAMLKEELADITIFLLRMCDKTGVDLESAINEKITKNAEKYPVSLAKGNAKKYTEFTQ